MVWPDPNVVAAAVTSGGVVIAAWISVGVKRWVSKKDTTASGLAAQLSGWDRYTGRLQARVDALEKRDQQCQQRLAQLESENETLKERLASLEQRLLPS